MKRYSFKYFGNKSEELDKLIEYLEEGYGLKYLEIREFHPKISLSIKGVNLFSWGRFKQVIFKENSKIKEVEKCKDCNYPASKRDLKRYNKNLELLGCRCCSKDVYQKKGRKWRKFQNSVK